MPSIQGSESEGWKIVRLRGLLALRLVKRQKLAMLVDFLQMFGSRTR